jgi:aldose 1-epimerase
MIDQFDVDPYLAVRHASAAPWPRPRGPRIDLAAGDLTASIHPLDACRLTSLTAYGNELMRQWTPQRRAFQYGSFPMVPWVGRMGNGLLHFDGGEYHLPVNKPPHALHGMACYGPWDILAVTDTTAEFGFRLAEPWPWPGVAKQQFELTPEALVTTLTVETDDAPFPAAAGWHPWFTKWTGTPEDVAHAPIGAPSDELRIHFAADWQEEQGDDELPTGRRIAPCPGPWDDAFGFDTTMNATLTWPGRARLVLTSPATSMVAFTTQPDAACVEPLSGPPNGINTDQRIVTASQPLVISARWALDAL